MKKNLWVLVLVALLAMTLALTGCGNGEDNGEDVDPNDNGEATDPDDDNGEDEDVEDFFVGLVTDTGGIDDQSFNQGTWEGIQEFADEYGAETNYLQSEADADYVPNLSSFADDQVDLIVAPGFLFEDAIGQVADNFPNQNFLLIDAVVERDNIVNAIFAEEQGSFLVGVAAALTAQEAGEDTVGYIGGVDFELIQKFEAGFEAGVWAVDPDMNVLVEYVGDFSDPSTGGSIASIMFDDGAYVIYHAAGGSGNGMINEAMERRGDGDDVWAIGVDRDQYEDGIYDGENSAILTSMMKRVDVAAYEVAVMTYEGNFPGGQIIEFDLENQGVSLPEENPNLSDDIIAEVQNYIDQIVSGEIEVPTLPSRLQ